MSSQACKKGVTFIKKKYRLSERRACELIQISRSTMRYQSKSSKKFGILRKKIIEIALQKKSYGYRRIHVLLKRNGICVNHKKVYKIYKKEGLMKRKKKKKKLVREKNKLELPKALNQVWAMDFMSDALSNGNKIRTLNIIDIFSRECISLQVDRSISSTKVISILEYLEFTRGLPEKIRVDNGPEYISKRLQEWTAKRNIKLDYIQPGKPTQNAFIESFNGKFREECLDQNWFINLNDAKQIVEEWRQEYNKERPHSAIGYMTPEEFASKKLAMDLFTNKLRTIPQQADEERNWNKKK